VGGGELNFVVQLFDEFSDASKITQWRAGEARASGQDF
jgi:hypothetical protein